MKEYHKIQTCFKRDEKTKHIIENDWTLPEFDFLKDNQCNICRPSFWYNLAVDELNTKLDELGRGE